MKIMVLNGPNLNLLGLREPAIYGQETYEDLCRYLDMEASKLDMTLEIIQSNHEGILVDEIQRAHFEGFAGIVLNPAAYTHTSVAILDTLKAIPLPAVEVHLSEPNEREDFRRISYAGQACVARFAGERFLGYGKALRFLKEHH